MEMIGVISVDMMVTGGEIEVLMMMLRGVMEVFMAKDVNLGLKRYQPLFLSQYGRNR